MWSVELFLVHSNVTHLVGLSVDCSYKRIKQRVVRVVLASLFGFVVVVVLFCFYYGVQLYSY